MLEGVDSRDRDPDFVGFFSEPNTSERHPELTVKAIELNRTLSDVLAGKGDDVEFSDFLTHATGYDRILMNPPFENGQPIVHVQHACSLLSSRGRLVSVMSEGPFFRGDKKAAVFRERICEMNGESEELPDGAFQSKEAFRQTAVRTRLVSPVKQANPVVSRSRKSVQHPRPLA
jgi:hypothetical protein